LRNRALFFGIAFEKELAKETLKFVEATMYLPPLPPFRRLQD